MISHGVHRVTIKEIYSITNDRELLKRYLGITKIPCLICSPLRVDKKPSFSLYTKDGDTVYFKDFSTGDWGGVLQLLSRLWRKSFRGTLQTIYLNYKIPSLPPSALYKSRNRKRKSRGSSNIEVEVREWEEYDLQYWQSYGITKPWLEYADVYPVSRTIITRNKSTFVYKADKYAYAYVEHKEGKTSIKVYQPFNTNGFKWQSKHDASVISLWTKIPKTGHTLCICSSLKDALCLWINTGIPAIAPQGEGYYISKTAIKALKSRFKVICILFDADDAGVKDAENLSKKTGFINVKLPKINNQKDISDIYKSINDKTKFKELILNLFREAFKIF